MRFVIITGAACLVLLGGCTERRRASAPVPDGDTIEVVIPEGGRHEAQRALRIIEIDDREATDVTQDTPESSEPMVPSELPAPDIDQGIDLSTEK